MQREEKRTEDGENVYFKALAKHFFVSIKKLFMVDLLSNGLHEKNNMLYYYVILLKVDQMCSLLRKSPWKWSLVNR